jgi:CheY-like chemotaxis protein
MRLIAITGYGQPEDRTRALDAGFDAHVTKPVSPERLAELLGAGRDMRGVGE